LNAAGFWGWTSDPYIGNYGDNSLLYFHQYQNAAPGSPLYQAALTGTDAASLGTDFPAKPVFFDQLEADVKGGKLPSVSWIVAPEAYTEHPAWPAGYGAWYTAGVLDALTSNPEVWSKTALIITFDENDGRLDGADHRRVLRRPARDAEGLAGRPRPLRPRHPRSAARGLALEHRRLRLLGGLRPQLADPLRRGPVRRQGAQHHPVAARR